MLSSFECKLVVEKYLKINNNFEILNYHATPLTLKGLNSEYVLLNVLITPFGYNTENNLKFIVKRLKSNSDYQITFAQEISNQKWLNKVAFVPKIYWTNNDSIIVFENFLNPSFVLPTDPNNLDVIHIQIVLETLAKYSTIADGVSTNCNVERIKQKLFNIGFNSLSNVIKESFKTEIELNDLKKLKLLYLESLNTLQTLEKCKKGLCHGYMWENNVSFNYNNALPTKCKLFNLELQHLNYPAYDVLHFLYRCTTLKQRQNHFHNLLQFYYNCLTRERNANNLRKLSFRKDFEISVHVLLPIVKMESICFRLMDLKIPPKINGSTLNEMRFVAESVYELKELLINRRITIEDCYKIIKNTIGTTEYKLLKYDTTPLCTMSGYLGDHQKLKISLEINDTKTDLYLFSKFMPKPAVALNIILDMDGFSKETFVYNIFLPFLQNLNLPFSLDFTVPCYFSRYNDVLIFQDFEYLGYKTLDTRTIFPYEVLKIVIKKLAKFHASSIIYEEEMSKTTGVIYRMNQYFKKEFSESLYSKIENHQGSQCMLTGIASIELLLNLFPEKDPYLSNDNVLSKVKLLYQKVFDLVEASTEFRNVACHGDLWVNNILVQIVNGIPTDCRFIDFQIIRYCPPAHDVLAILYLCANRATREEYFDNLIQIYYEEFKFVLSTYGFDVEIIYTYPQFLKSIDVLRTHAIGQTALYYQLCLINQEIFKQFMVDEEAVGEILTRDRRNYIKTMYKHDPIFRMRMAEAIQELRELCVKLNS